MREDEVEGKGMGRGRTQWGWWYVGEEDVCVVGEVQAERRQRPGAKSCLEVGGEGSLPTTPSSNTQRLCPSLG